MDDELYDDESAEKSKPESVDEESSENPTALLPLSAFGGKAKVGDTVTMKVVKLHGDEVAVEISESEVEEPDSETKTDDELMELDEMEV